MSGTGVLVTLLCLFCLVVHECHSCSHTSRSRRPSLSPSLSSLIPFPSPLRLFPGGSVPTPFSCRDGLPRRTLFWYSDRSLPYFGVSPSFSSCPALHLSVRFGPRVLFLIPKVDGNLSVVSQNFFLNSEAKDPHTTPYPILQPRFT